MSSASKHSAGGQLAGYLFQCRLALLQGLQMAKSKPNGRISIEKYDDVAFEDDDYAACLLQAKHSITPKSIDDNSVDLWKTLDIWRKDLAQTVLGFSTTKYVLITTSVAKEDSACARLRPGASDAERKEALTILRQAAKNSKNNATNDAREAFLALSDDEAKTLLRQIEIIDAHPNLFDVMAEIESEIILTAPGHQESAASYLEGWWLGVVGKCLVDNASATVPVQHIIMKAHEIGKMFAEDALPIDEPDALGAKEYTDDDEEELFVRQMRAVGASDRIVHRGAQDYYRAFAQRSKWARENLLLDTELMKYDEFIKDKWARKFDAELETQNSMSEQEKRALGRSICLWASQQSIPLRTVVETWITAGTFQGLSDRLKVGWHPDYETIFGQEAHDDGT